MSSPDPITQLLVTVPVVILGCQAGARLMRRCGQPPVIGEITVGILLGPSLLGSLFPQAQQWLFPDSALVPLSALGTVGLLTFMFLAGLELDLGALRGQGRATLAVSQTGMWLPLGLGAVLALAMYGPLAPDGVGKPVFVMFIAVAMSITAFPVLARILDDRGLHGTPVGALAMACAAVDDVTAWCLLAVVMATIASTGLLGAGVTALAAAGFVVVLLAVVRPLLGRRAHLAERHADSVVMTFLVSGLFLAAFTTDRIGVHALFGAFLLGVAVPGHSRKVARCAGQMRTFVVPVLLPLYFVVGGLHTDVLLLVGSLDLWLWTAVVVVVAVAGKWGGTALAARAAGHDWNSALAIGALMNCRGLTELIVLNIGREQGVIGTELFTVLVVMALLSTAVTSPAVSRLLRGAPEPSGGAPASSGGAAAVGGTRHALRTAPAERPGRAA
ncbi:cation:proton antiporter domain-containing protein [Streptomyces werraensis]|uniref:cation:proton antiporter domain-containing protein n=1 Tax=Streptomyces werraensis TaxID=68284 RepID=UPI0034456270